MKQPKKLTRRQKICLSDNSLDCKDWMLIEEKNNFLIIINKNTNAVKVIDELRKTKKQKRVSDY